MVLAGEVGLEPTTYGLTDRRYYRLSYIPKLYLSEPLVVKEGLKPSYNLLLTTPHSLQSLFFTSRSSFLLYSSYPQTYFQRCHGLCARRLDASTSSRYNILHPYKESHQAGGGCFCFCTVCNFNKSCTTVNNATVSNW